MRRERVGLSRIGGQPLRREVVSGQPAGELVGAKMLEVARRRQVANLAVALRERVVRDLPDEALDEGVLATLGGARVHVADEQLASDERQQPWLQFSCHGAGDRRQSGDAKALPEDGGIGHELAVCRLQAIEARRDERGQRLRDGHVVESPDRQVRAALEHEAALCQQHPDRLHGV